jgi:hypothetical protein
VISANALSARSWLAGPVRAIRLFLAATAVFCLHTFAQAQSCALCYTQAASSGSRIIHGLRSGIIVLIIPPALMSIGITALAYRKRNQFHEQTKGSRPNGW